MNSKQIQITEKELMRNRARIAIGLGMRKDFTTAWKNDDWDDLHKWKSELRWQNKGDLVCRMDSVTSNVLYDGEAPVETTELMIQFENDVYYILETMARIAPLSEWLAFTDNEAN